MPDPAMTLKIDVLVPKLKWEKKRLRASMRAGGQEIASVTKALIQGGAKSGRMYRKPGGGTYRASAAGEAPASRSGNLAGKIKVTVGPGALSVEIREMVRYAWILEHGRNSPKRQQTRKVKGSKARVQVGIATKLEARPSISIALMQRGPSVIKRIEQSVALDMVFVKQKP